MTRSPRARALPRALLPLLAASALALASPALAQDTIPASARDTSSAQADPLVEVRLVDGSVIYGRVVAEDAETVTVVTQGGTRVAIRRDEIERMGPARGRVVGGEFWREDPHATRLFFGPTARSLDRGEGYFGVFELLFPFVAYGPTDRVTLAGGTPIIPDVVGRVLYLAPKVEVVRTRRASVAVGGLALFATQEVDEGSVGLAYGVGTFGTPDAALTVGAAFPFYVTDEESDLVDQPVIMLGGERRVGRRTKLITENYVLPADMGSLLSGGVRFFGDRLSADAGIVGYLEDGDLSGPYPLVNFVYSFGGKR